jgi:hypothetical protein
MADDMTILNTTGMQRKPSHPGEMLREDFLPDYGRTVSGLAESLGVSRQSIIVDFLTPSINAGVPL